jgi:hypothetical protein
MTLLAAKDISAGHGLHRPTAASIAAGRRGRVKNGNCSADFLAAPRCGAHIRCGGECRQPAMRSGRCRLHGGLSTGPRTPAGLARSRRARWKHGARSAEVTALRRAAHAQLGRVRAILAGTRVSAGHGVHRSNRGSPVGANTWGRPRGAADGRPHRAAPTIAPKIGVHLRPSAAKPSSSAGHGVHRSNPQPRPPASVLPTRRDCLRSSASIGGLTYARPLGMGFIA